MKNTKAKGSAKAQTGQKKADEKFRLNAYHIILIAVLILEITVFNYRFWCGLGSTPIELTNYEAGSGVDMYDNNRIKIKESGDKEIVFKDINAEVKNIYLDIVDVRSRDKGREKNGDVWDFNKLAVVVFATDDGNSQYFELPERLVVAGVERTKYIPIESTGMTDKIKLRFNGSENQTLIINSVQVNKGVPFSFNLFRIGFIYAVILAIYILRRNSSLYAKPLTWSYAQRCAVMEAIAINIIISAMVCFTNHRFMDIHVQYHDLAEAFARGEVALDFEPAQPLLDMENPYDTKLRDQVMAEAGTTYKWDHAYFEGKYYVYFGALPVLVYYLPYFKSTGEEFPVQWGVFINACVFIVFSYLLLKAIADRWFKKIPFVTYMLLCQVFVFSSGYIFGLRKADLYATPITMGLALVTAGLYFWISSENSKKLPEDIARLAIGSTCIALLSACRPQYLMAAFVAIPLFWDQVFRQRRLFSEKYMSRTLAFVMPFVIVAAAVMWYNKARFGSPFDFGANYNLTTNDMTHRGFKIDRIGLGVFAYFIQPPAFYARFPFITSANLSNYYGGVTIMEVMFGGVLASQPVVWLCVMLKNIKSELKQKGIFALALSLIAFAFVVGIADAEMAGILCRYYMDFSYLIIIAAVLAAFTLYEKYGDRAAYVISVLSGLSLAYDFAMLFVFGDYGHEWTNPNFYYGIVSALTFWM
ncbi:MAG: hypothetical protein IKS17_08665 [Firmicutes bacterium]|nr:hypothetical protein [Bacillota bacterium]